MENSIEILNYQDHTIEVHQDIDAENPREWDNLGTMVCWHSRYTLGDEQPDSSVDDWRRKLACELDTTLEERIDYWENGKGWSYLENQYRTSELYERVSNMISDVLDEKLAVMLPLYLYDHSGITMNTSRFSCPWDSGQVGWIYVSKEDVKEECCRPRPKKEGQINPDLEHIKRITKGDVERVRGYLKGEINTYDKYISGQVYGYIIKDCNDEIIDSCYGFYDLDYMKSEAKAVIGN